MAPARISLTASTRALSGAFGKLVTASLAESYSAVMASVPRGVAAVAAFALELSPMTLNTIATTGMTDLTR